MKNKKQKLVIPWEYIKWIIPALVARNGEITDNWDQELNRIGWLQNVRDLEEPKSNVPNIPKVPPMPEEKSELMTLQEIFEKCNPGDTVQGKGLHLIMKDNGALYYKHNEAINETPALLVKHDFLKKEWKIIPAEPKVLSADEIFNNHPGWTLYDNDIISLNSFESIYKIVDQNGQLKQWLNHKELREVCQGFIDASDIHNRIQGPLKQ